jgi:hypothetical protein
MSTKFYDYEITPERIAEVTRRARIERSQALWRILDGIFKSRASQEPLKPFGAAPKPSC